MRARQPGVLACVANMLQRRRAQGGPWQRELRKRSISSRPPCREGGRQGGRWTASGLARNQISLWGRPAAPQPSPPQAHGLSCCQPHAHLLCGQEEAGALRLRGVFADVEGEALAPGAPGLAPHEALEQAAAGARHVAGALQAGRTARVGRVSWPGRQAGRQEGRRAGRHFGMQHPPTRQKSCVGWQMRWATSQGRLKNIWRPRRRHWRLTPHLQGRQRWVGRQAGLSASSGWRHARQTASTEGKHAASVSAPHSPPHMAKWWRRLAPRRWEKTRSSRCSGRLPRLAATSPA